MREGNNKAKTSGTRYFDFALLFVVLFLLSFGLIMVYSASSHNAAVELGDSTYFLMKQLQANLLGLFFMIIAIFMPYKFYKKFPSIILYSISIILILALLSPLGITRNGATRWLNLGVSVQVAEVVKVCVIFIMAKYILENYKKIKSSWKRLFVTLMIPVPLCMMIYLISGNLSSAIIIFGIGFVIIAISVMPPKITFLICSVGAVIVTGVVVAIDRFASGQGSFRFRRILAWLHPENYAGDTAYQTRQSLYAIGSGGPFGSGLGQSLQKYGDLPEIENDMIFAIICEEMGVFGAIAIIMLFVILIWRLMIISVNASDKYGALLVVGIMAHLSIQVVLNISVATGVLPNTGVTLPFISSGGSSALLFLVEIGVAINVSRNIRIAED